MADKIKPRKWIETIPGMWMCGNCGEYITVFMTECPKCGKDIGAKEFYKEEESSYQIKSDYWFAIADVLKRAKRSQVSMYNDLNNVIEIICQLQFT